jgi:hypothetical protein
MDRQSPILSQSCCTTPSAAFFWGGLFLLFYAGGLMLRSAWAPIGPFGDTLILAAMAAACFINFGRNRTLHCALTGPVFVVAAVVAALQEAGVWDLDIAAVWVVVACAVGVAFFVEWRTVGRKSASIR